MTKHRTASSLLASGAATITLDQRLDRPRLRATADALRADRQALRGDGARALNRLTDALAHR